MSFGSSIWGVTATRLNPQGENSGHTLLVGREGVKVDYAQPLRQRSEDVVSCADAGGLATARAETDSIQIPLPSFFVVGPPRTGTSWIHQVLQRHANLPTPTKETRFFDCHFHRGVDWYLKHFPEIRPECPTGEIAPTYFASAEAREAIAQTIPGAKLIFVFRNPVQRIVSLYRVKRAYGLLRCSLEEALRDDPELIASAQYATYLQKWTEAFPREQMLVTLYDDLCASPQRYMDRLFTFLDVPGEILSKAEQRHVHSSERMTQPRNFLVTRTATAIADWCKAHNLDNLVASVRESQLREVFLGGGAPFPEVSHSVRRRIKQLFWPEVESLQTMIGRDLSMWNS